MASPQTIQPSTADTYIMGDDPTVAHGTETRIYVQPNTTNLYRSLLSFDFSASVPVGATITLATLSLYCVYATASRTVTVYRLLRTDWSEAQATWNIYKTGSNWGTAGAKNSSTDYTSTDAVTINSRSTAGWMEWDITGQTQVARDSVGGVLHCLVADDGASATAEQDWRTRDYAVDTTLRPKLYIEYTEAAAGPALLKTVNGLAKASVKTLRSGLLIASGKTFDGLA